MKYNYRPAKEKDFQGILDLIKALALFEKAPEKVTNSVERMKKEQDYFNCFVVEDTNKNIIGIALYYFVYYTWVGKSLYLDDLYVKKEHRGKQIGSKLLNLVFEVAKKEECQRVRWQVLDWNQPAIDFYNKKNATLDGEWINCDFDKQKINQFLKNES